jgi:rare lipoprotein A
MRPLQPAFSAVITLLALCIVPPLTSTATQAAPANETKNVSTDFSAREKSLRYGQRSHRVRKSHNIRHSAGRGFAWYFANMHRIEPRTPCAGNRVVATWYHSGHRTANGERFNPNGLTAAHRTLPFGTRLSITNPRNGRSITVRINDRGPFTRGVTIDLARGAAFALGMTATQQVCML